MINGEKPKKYMQRELTEENIPFISKESGVSETELLFMYKANQEMGKPTRTVRWEVKDE